MPLQGQLASLLLQGTLTLHPFLRLGCIPIIRDSGRKRLVYSSGISNEIIVFLDR